MLVKRTTRDLVLSFVTINGNSLKHAPKFQDDLEVVQTAIQSNPAAFYYASERLRDQEEVSFLAISQGSGHLLEKASSRLRSSYYANVMRLFLKDAQSLGI